MVVLVYYQEPGLLPGLVERSSPMQVEPCPPISSFNRAQHCRRIASLGGQALVRIHGTEHMSQIGAKGFKKALELGWGLELAAKLSASYSAKYGKPITLGAQSKQRARIRAAARRFYGGMPCDNCDAPGGQVHHLDINADNPNAGGYIQILCSACHRAEHRRLRVSHLRRRVGQ